MGIVGRVGSIAQATGASSVNHQISNICGRAEPAKRPYRRAVARAAGEPRRDGATGETEGNSKGNSRDTEPIMVG